jgi:adenosine deaminase
VKEEQKVLDFFLERTDDICGLDLANDEKFSCIPFSAMFSQAKAKNMGLTCHAGELTSAQSVADAVHNLNVTRIGHGFRCIHDESIMKLLVEKNILLEICPISNIRTGAVSSISDHPIRDLVTRGVSCCINSDDPGVFNSSLIDDYSAVITHHNFSLRELYQCNINALNASFLSFEKKAVIKDKYFASFELWLQFAFV